MGSKRGRKSAYETRIKPRLDEIADWLANGATDKQIAHNLGIAASTLEKYKAANAEFTEFLKKGRQNLVIQLRGALVQKALGFEYEEVKHVERIESDGAISESTETFHRKALPDVAALNLCLKNYDPDNWANDPQMLALRKEELKLKKQQAEQDGW